MNNDLNNHDRFSLGLEYKSWLDAHPHPQQNSALIHNFFRMENLKDTILKITAGQ